MRRAFLLMIVCSLYLIGSPLCGQTYIRIYDIHGKRTGRGNIELLADTVIVLSDNKKQLKRYLIKDISFIRKHHSAIAYAGVGSVTGFLISGKIAMGLDAYFNANEKSFNTIVISGAALGAVTGLFVNAKGKRKLIINGDIERWKTIAEVQFANYPIISE